MTTLKIIKLISGEEIIGLVQDGKEIPPTEDGYTSDNLVLVSSPMRITTTYDQITRTHALYLSDWVPSIIDETMAIDKRQIITLGNPNPDVEDHYSELVMIHRMSREEDDDTPNKKLLKNHKFDDDDVQ